MAIATIAIKPKPKLTYEDYASLPDDERCELIDGELIPMLSPKEIHQAVSGTLFMSVCMFVRIMGLGRIYFAPFDVILSADQRRPARPVLHIQRALPYNHGGQHTRRAGPRRRNPVPIHGGLRQDDQAKPLRPPRRHGILADRPIRQNRNRANLRRERLQYPRRLWQRRYTNLAHPRRLQR